MSSSEPTKQGKAAKPRLLAKCPALKPFLSTDSGSASGAHASTDEGSEFRAAADKILTRQAKYQFPEDWKARYARDSGKYWNIFYKTRETLGFKDRHWLLTDFPELGASDIVVLECGCGVGNTALPLLEANPSPGLFVHCFDFSPKAIRLLHTNEVFNQPENVGRISAFVADFTKESESIIWEEDGGDGDGAGSASARSEKPKAGSVDVATLIYVLSALTPSTMHTALNQVKEALKPGTGVVLVRDYAVYDLAQLRFSPHSRIEENLYVRSDGTMSYFFSTESLSELFDQCGFEVVDCRIVEKLVENKQECIRMQRKFVELRAIVQT